MPASLMELDHHSFSSSTLRSWGSWAAARISKLSLGVTEHPPHHPVHSYPALVQPENHVLDCLPHEDSFSDLNTILAPETCLAEQTRVLDKVRRILEAAEQEEEDPPFPFNGQKIPAISTQAYLERIVKYTNTFCEDQAGVTSSGIRTVLLALELIQRSRVKVTRRSIHRLILVACLVSIKSQEDYPISNHFFAVVGGIEVKEMNQLESTFCAKLDYCLHVTLTQYQAQQVATGVFNLKI